MSLFDVIAAALIAVSAVVGFRNGAIKEVIGLVAFAVSAIAALSMLPVTVRMAGAVFHPHFLAVAVAVVSGFAVVYLALKLFGEMVRSQLHAIPALGGMDQAIGLFIGAVRAFIVLGLFALVFDRATPSYLRSPTITQAFLYPLAQVSGRMIERFAPRSLQSFGPGDRVLPAPEDRAEDPTPRPAAAKSRPIRPQGRGYDQHSRDQLDRLVERSR